VGIECGSLLLRGTNFRRAKRDYSGCKRRRGAESFPGSFRLFFPPLVTVRLVAIGISHSDGFIRGLLPSAHSIAPSETRNC